MKTSIVAILCLALCLCACAPASPTAPVAPVPSRTAAVSTVTSAASVVVAPSNTPAPTNTTRPSATITLTRTHTPVPSASRTSTARATFAVRPSNTPRPLTTAQLTATAQTATPTTGPLNLFSYTPVPVSVPVGGFSFTLPAQFHAEVNDNSANLVTPLSGAALVFTGEGSMPPETTPTSVLAFFLDQLFLTDDGYTYTTANPRATSAAGAPGQRVDLNIGDGTSVWEGEAFAAVSAEGRVLFGAGFIKLNETGKGWRYNGQPAFEQVLASLRFIPISQGTCTVSTDESFAYTQENPIHVGGGWAGGLARESAYMANLRGPQGEALSYARTGLVAGPGGVYLDVYTVSYGSQETPTPFYLYMDMYTYAAPVAPAGLTCAGAFSIAAP